MNTSACTCANHALAIVLESLLQTPDLACAVQLACVLQCSVLTLMPSLGLSNLNSVVTRDCRMNLRMRLREHGFFSLEESAWRELRLTAANKIQMRTQKVAARNHMFQAVIAVVPQILIVGSSFPLDYCFEEHANAVRLLLFASVWLAFKIDFMEYLPLYGIFITISSVAFFGF